MFELKPDFEDVLDRYEAWWNCVIVDRPLVSIVFPVPVQNRKKALQIQYMPVGDLDLLFESLAPEGVWISHLAGISSLLEAEDALSKIAQWTRRR